MVLKNKGDQEFDVSGRWCAVVKLGAGGSGAGKTSPGESEAVWGRAGRKHPPPHVSTSRSPPCETGQGQRETQEVGKCSYPLPKGLDKFKKFTL